MEDIDLVDDDVLLKAMEQYEADAEQNSAKKKFSEQLEILVHNSHAQLKMQRDGMSQLVMISRKMLDGVLEMRNHVKRLRKEVESNERRISSLEKQKNTPQNDPTEQLMKDQKRAQQEIEQRLKKQKKK